MAGEFCCFSFFFLSSPFSLLFFREYSLRGVNRGAKIKIKGKNIGLKIFFGGGKMDLNINWIRVYRIGYGFQYSLIDTGLMRYNNTYLVTYLFILKVLRINKRDLILLNLYYLLILDYF